jgi:metal-responsive CopG/Arc/MetJ family transcriptional regulator
MSRITVTIPNELMDALLEVVEAKSKTQAVIDAIKNEIKRKKRKKIIELAGKIEFTSDARMGFAAAASFWQSCYRAPKAERK